MLEREFKNKRLSQNCVIHFISFIGEKLCHSCLRSHDSLAPVSNHPGRTIRTSNKCLFAPYTEWCSSHGIYIVNVLIFIRLVTPRVRASRTKRTFPLRERNSCTLSRSINNNNEPATKLPYQQRTAFHCHDCMRVCVCASLSGYFPWYVVCVRFLVPSEAPMTSFHS